MSSAPESLPCDSVGEAPSELALLALSLVAGSGFLPLGSRSAAAADRDAAGGDRLDEVSMERRMGGWGRRAPAAAPLPLAGAWTVVSLCRATWADSRLLCAEQRLCERRPALAPREAEEARRMTEFGGAAPPAPRTRLAAVASRGDARRLAELLSAYGPRAAAREVAHEDGRLLGRALQSPLTSFVTPLARACHGRHAGAAAALIAAGAPATAAACVAAARSHDAGIVALLLDASAAAADAAAGAWAVGLADAVACGADGIVRLILARKVVPQPDVDGALCLMRISRVTPPGAQPQPVRHVDTARALLDAGAPAGGPPPLPLPVGASDHCALATPLLRAIADGFGEVAHLLLARGADSDAVCCAPDVLRDIPAIRHRGGRDGRRGAGGLRGDDGVTPLHAAVLSGEYGLAATLIERGARTGRVVGASIDLADCVVHCVQRNGDAAGWRFVARLVSAGGLLPRGDAVPVLERLLASKILAFNVHSSECAARSAELEAWARDLCSSCETGADAAAQLLSAACRGGHAATAAALLPLARADVRPAVAAALQFWLPDLEPAAGESDDGGIAGFTDTRMAWKAPDADVATLVRALHAAGVATDDAVASAAAAAPVAANSAAAAAAAAANSAAAAAAAAANSVAAAARRKNKWLGAAGGGRLFDGGHRGGFGGGEGGGSVGSDGGDDDYGGGGSSGDDADTDGTDDDRPLLINAVALELPLTVTSLLSAPGAAPLGRAAQRALRAAVFFCDSTPSYHYYNPHDISDGYSPPDPRVDWGGGAAVACALLAAGVRADADVLCEAARRGYADVVGAILAGGLVPPSRRPRCESRAMSRRVVWPRESTAADAPLAHALAGAVCSGVSRIICGSVGGAPPSEFASRLDADLAAVVAQLLAAGALAGVGDDGMTALLADVSGCDGNFAQLYDARAAAAAAGVPVDAVVCALYACRPAMARALLAGGCSAAAASALPACCEAALACDADDVLAALLAAARERAPGADIFAPQDHPVPSAPGARRHDGGSGAEAAGARRQHRHTVGLIPPFGWRAEVSAAAERESAAGGWWRLALHRCACASQRGGGTSAPRCATMLIGAGARVDARDGAGWAPLHLAALFGAADVTAALVAAGADVDARLAPGADAAPQAASAEADRSAAFASRQQQRRGAERVVGDNARAHSAALRALRVTDTHDADVAVARADAAARAARIDDRVRVAAGSATRARSAPAAMRARARDDADIIAAAEACASPHAYWGSSTQGAGGASAADTARVLFGISSAVAAPLAAQRRSASAHAAVAGLPDATRRVLADASVARARAAAATPPPPSPPSRRRSQTPSPAPHGARAAAPAAVAAAPYGHARVAADELEQRARRAAQYNILSANVALEHLARTGATPLLLAAAPFGSSDARGKAAAVAVLVAARADTRAALRTPRSAAPLLEELLGNTTSAGARVAMAAGLLAELPPGATALRLAHRAGAAGGDAVRALGGTDDGIDGAPAGSVPPPPPPPPGGAGGNDGEQAAAADIAAYAAAGRSADWIEARMEQRFERRRQASADERVEVAVWPDKLTPIL